MAGFYPDEADYRIAYDVDGSSVYYVTYSSNVSVLMDPGDVIKLNAENNASGPRIGGSFAIVFPQEMVISNILLITSGGSGRSNVYAEYSLDSLNGVDGTWTAWSEGYAGVGGDRDFDPASTRDYSLWANPTSPVLCKAIRIGWKNGQANGRCLFLLGHEPSLGQSLYFWHPTLDERLSPSYFDWGNSYIGQDIPEKQFRVKNCSSTKVAEDIALGVESLRGQGNPTMAQSHTLSHDGLSYASEINIASLGPGEISPVMHIKYAPQEGAVQGPDWSRVYARAGSWL